MFVSGLRTFVRGHGYGRLSSTCCELRERVAHIMQRHHFSGESSPVAGSNKSFDQRNSFDDYLGQRAWKQCFGVEVQGGSHIDATVSGIMKQRCPYWSDREVRDTHRLVWVPDALGRVSMNFFQLQKIFNSKPSLPLLSWGWVLERKLQDSVSKPYWALITREPIPRE